MSERLAKPPKRFVLQPCSGHGPANEATAAPDAYRASNTHACKLSKMALSELVPELASAVYLDTGILIEGLVAELRTRGYERIKVESWDKKTDPRKLELEELEAEGEGAIRPDKETEEWDAQIVFGSSHGLCVSCFRDIHGDDVLKEYWPEGYKGRPLYLG